MHIAFFTKRILTFSAAAFIAASLCAAENPFIGPSPTVRPGSPQAGGNQNVAPITVTYNGKQTTASFLLDTGAAASMISSKLAAKLGISQENGKLVGPPPSEQFSFTIGGIGGQKKSPGFYLDSLTLPTREGDPLVYKKAPVIVSDIEVEDPTTHEKLTLDGVLGMNYFVASANVEEAGLLPDINHLTACAYDWITIDEPAGVLGLKLKKEFAEASKPQIEIRKSQPPKKK